MAALDFTEQIKALEQQGLYRQRYVIETAPGPYLTVDGKTYLSFCSNDYLGLANHPALIEAVQTGAGQFGVGAGASHLLAGHLQPHHTLEQALAEFVALPKALLFSSGYMANLGVVTALAGRHDALFCDKLNHASLNDAALLSRATIHRYPHVDLAGLETRLARSTHPRKLIISDAVFSMDGNVAPVPELLALAEKYDAWLLLDDAHGFGLLGKNGRGVLSHFNLQSPRIIYMATLGKAAGVYGAFVAGEASLIDWLIQRARTYIYTTATPAMLAQTLQTSLKLIAENNRREHLLSLISKLKEGLLGLPWKLLPSNTPIQPLMIGSASVAVKLSAALRQHGILVPAIRPPTVPTGSARLRISLSASHTEADIEQLISTFHQLT